MHELPSKGVLLGTAGLMGFLLLCVYGASLGNDFVRFDDGLLIYENPVVRETSFRSLKAAFTTYDPELYIPLTLLSYKFDYLIGGANPFLYHVHNLLLHAANAFLVLLVVYVLTGNRIVALGVSLLFAVHPLHTETVAWASARKDLLSTFFFLLALLSYLFYRERKTQHGQTDSATTVLSVRGMYFLSVTFFLLGLLSKVMVLTLPLVLLLIDFRERRKWDRRMLAEKLPYFFLSIVFGVIALYGKQAVTAQATLSDTALMAAKSTVFYLTKLIVPIRLSVLYPYTGAIALSEPAFFVPLLILSLLGALLLFSLRWTRELFFGFAFFLLTLAPTFINFSKDGESYFASDRYAYIPSIGILFIIALFMVWLLRQRKFHASRSKFHIMFPFLAVACVFSVLTFRQSLVWADTETLFRAVLRFYPNAHRAHNNLGNVHRRRGELEEAINAFESALAIKVSARTLANLGSVYRKQGRMEEAIAIHERAIALAPFDPEPHFSLGIVYAQTGDYEKARREYDRALELDPAYADVFVNLGALLMQEGDVRGAIAAYERAIALQSTHVQAHFNLGVALVKGGELTRGRVSYENAIAVDPFFLPARLNLGVLLAHLGEIALARLQFEEVLTQDPGNALARSALEQISGVRE